MSRIISVVAVALVLALTIVLAGVAASLDIEVDRTLDQLGVDHWVVKSDASGPFFGSVPMPEATVGQVAALDGVEEAQPQVFYAYTLNSATGPKSITLFGVAPGKLGAPASRILAKQSSVIARFGRPTRVLVTHRTEATQPVAAATLRALFASTS